MTIKSRFQSMAALIEFLVGGGLGIFFHWVLHNKDASYTIFGIGTLMSLATYLIKEQMGHVRTNLLEQYRHCHEVTFALASISDPACQAKAQELFSTLSVNIPLLQKGYIPLDESEFYLEAAKAADAAEKTIDAIDTLFPRWTPYGGIVNFYQANLRAVERGVKVRRVFFITREEFRSSDVEKIILTQISDGIDIRIVFRDEIPAVTGWGSSSSFNFTVYDGRVVTEVEAGHRTFFGIKTTQKQEVEQFLRLFTLLEHSTHRIVLKDGRVTVMEQFTA